MDTLYRFRDLGQLLDRHQELENQEIYFANPEELNDPLEGLRDIAWHGDRIAWDNLFNHYILCLQWMVHCDLLFGEHLLISPKTLPIKGLPNGVSYDDWCKRYSPNLKNIYEVMDIENLISCIIESDRKIRRPELIFILRMIRPVAYALILNFHNELGITTDAMKLGDLSFLLDDKIEWSEYFEHTQSLSEDGLLLYFENYGIVVELRRALINMGGLGLGTSNKARNLRLLLWDFDDIYLEEIQRLTRPEWFAASFTNGYSNATQWSHYADDHKGVCLMFDPKVVDSLADHLLQALPDGSNSMSKVESTTIEFHNVSYKNTVEEIDFFGSIGHTASEEVIRIWYSGDDGEVSTKAPDSSSRMVRVTLLKKFMADFMKNVSVKTSDWSHEDESRIIASSAENSLNSRDIRKANYDFQMLEGVIFGMKTPPYAKMRVMEIVDRKCDDQGRAEFKFMQAYFSRATNAIELAVVDRTGEPIDD